jgi:hypothetical protein
LQNKLAKILAQKEIYLAAAASGLRVLAQWEVVGTSGTNRKERESQTNLLGSRFINFRVIKGLYNY